MIWYKVNLSSFNHYQASIETLECNWGGRAAGTSSPPPCNRAFSIYANKFGDSDANFGHPEYISMFQLIYSLSPYLYIGMEDYQNGN